MFKLVFIIIVAFGILLISAGKFSADQHAMRLTKCFLITDK